MIRQRFLYTFSAKGRVAYPAKLVGNQKDDDD
jgi:hypothetical protein